MSEIDVSVPEIENQWPVPQRPMSLGEIYRSSLRLSMRTAARGLTAAILVIVPLYVLFTMSAHSFFIEAARIFGAQTDVAGEITEEALAGVYAQIAGEASLLMLMVFALVVASTIVQLAVTVESWDRSLLVERSTSEWLARIAGRPLAMAVAQLVLLMMFIMMIFGVVLLFGAILAGAAGPSGLSIAVFAAIGLLAFLALKVAFRLHEIVADDRGPWRSLVSSAALVRGRWFKVFATLFPIAVAIVVLSEVLQRVAGGAVDTSSVQGVDATNFAGLAAGYRALADAFTVPAAIALGTIAAVGQFFVVNVLTALYVDLRARRGDFDYDEAVEVG